MLDLGEFCKKCLCAVCKYRKGCESIEGDTDLYCHEECNGDDGWMRQCTQFEKEVNED